MTGTCSLTQGGYVDSETQNERGDHQPVVKAEWIFSDVFGDEAKRHEEDFQDDEGDSHISQRISRIRVNIVEW